MPLNDAGRSDPGARRPASTIQIARPKLSGNELAYVTDCIESGWISSAGQYVDRFERSFAADVAGTRFAAACSNGTVALHLALLALGVGPGDEVIVPTLTYVGVGERRAVLRRHPGVRRRRTGHDEHLARGGGAGDHAAHEGRDAGAPVRAPRGRGRARACVRAPGIRMVEDAAEAHGATVGGRPVGSLGDIATFSFFGNKIITTGEGGMVTTDDPELDGYVRLFKGQGQDPERRYWFPVIGYNYRMTNVTAAIGLAQTERFADHLADRQRVADGTTSTSPTWRRPSSCPSPGPGAPTSAGCTPSCSATASPSGATS